MKDLKYTCTQRINSIIWNSFLYSMANHVVDDTTIQDYALSRRTIFPPMQQKIPSQIQSENYSNSFFYPE
jgi:hypothetical protein